MSTVVTTSTLVTTGEAQIMSSKWNKNKKTKQKCAQFQVNSQIQLKNHVLYISHIRVNAQQAFAILLDLKTYVMVAFWYYWKYNPMQQVLHFAAFFTIISSNTFMMKISWNLLSCAMIMYVLLFRKKVIKRRGQDIGVILIHDLFQIKLIQIRNFENFK